MHYNFEIFHMREKNIPVDIIEIKEPIQAFAWEPIGSKFAIVQGEQNNTKVAFYDIKSAQKLSLMSTYLLLSNQSAKVSINYCTFLRIVGKESLLAFILVSGGPVYRISRMPRWRRCFGIHRYEWFLDHGQRWALQGYPSRMGSHWSIRSISCERVESKGKIFERFLKPNKRISNVLI